MNRKALFTLLPILGLALALGAMLVGLTGAAGAQGLQSEGDVGVQQVIVGTTFTYQGRLFENDNPAGGTFDFQFKLYDAESGGDQVGSTVIKADVPVTDGVFAVKLDFGPNAFTGEARWLEVGARPGDQTSDFTPLSPRQELTPAPYALALPGLRTQPNPTSSNVIGGYVGNTVIGDVMGATIGGGGGPPDPHYERPLYNAVTDHYGTVGGGERNQAGNDDGTIHDATHATVGGGTHNFATDHGATVSGGELNAVHGKHGMVGGGYQNTAYGAWATISGGHLNVISDSGDDDDSYDYAAIGGGRDNRVEADYATVPGGEGNTAAGDYSFAAGRRAKAFHDGTFVWADSSSDDSFESTDANQFLVRANGGALFIGDLDSGGTLDITDLDGRYIAGFGVWNGILGPYAVWGETSSPLGEGVRGVNSAEDAGVGVVGIAHSYGVWGGADDIGVFGRATARWGKGVEGNASGENGAGVRGHASGDNGVGVRGGTSGRSGRGVEGWATDSDGLGVYGWATGSNGRGVYGWATGSNGWGVFGVAEGENGRGVHALATSSAGWGVFGRALGEYGHGVHGYAFGSEGVAVHGHASGSDGRGVHGFAEGENGRGVHGFASGNEGYAVYAEATGTNGTGIFATGGPSGYAADFQGNVILRSRDTGETIMELGEGLDYAEGFDVSDVTEVAPGTVLVIDADHPGKLKSSETPYDRKVAGIVSGAKGMGSAVRLGPGQFDYDVALAGRVYCNVDATEESVEPGDLLTTSATPGYAMKATDYARAQGAILGKAMEGLAKGERGQILVLVTLQ